MTTPGFRTETIPIPELADAETVRISGRATFAEAGELRRTILENLSDLSASKVVLQLSAIEQMDTSGAAVLAEALKFGQARGMRVLLCSPSMAVMRIFRLAGFEEVLDQCCADPDETWQRLQD